MAVCPKCGSQVADGAKFCASCGAPMQPVPPASSASPAGSSAPPPAQPTSTGQSGIAPNVAAMLTYVPVCLVGLICAILFGFILEPFKNQRFVRFHAWQSLAVHGALLVFWLAWMVISGILTAILHIFALITLPVSLLVGLGALVLMIFLMLKAYANESYKLPVIGEWAEKQAGT